MASEPHIPTPQTFQDDSINFKKYLFIILANWYWFVISVFITVGFSWLINRYTMPVYKVTGSLIISEDKGKGLTGYENLIPGTEIYRTQKAVLNEIEILKSYDMAIRTLDSLDFDVTYMGVGRSGFKEVAMYNSCPFVVIPSDSLPNLKNYPVYIQIDSKTEYQVQIDDQFNIKKTVKFGEEFRSGSFNFRIVLRDPRNFSPDYTYNKYYFKFNSLNSLAANFRAGLAIQTNDQKRGSVLFLSMSGNNPFLISDYLNKLMNVYIMKGLNDKNETARRTVEFIDRQLFILDDSLVDAEERLKNFHLANELIDVKTEGNTITLKHTDLDARKKMAELQNRYYSYLQDYVNTQNNLNKVVAPSIVDISDPFLTQMLFDLNKLITEKEELLYSVQPGNPKISMIDLKIESAREALSNNIDNLLENNNILIKDLNRQLDEARQELRKFPVTEREYISLQRQYKVNDQIYTYLLQKRAESAIAEASNVSDNKILDIARPGNAIQVSPKTRANTIKGFSIGLLIPLIMLILLDLFNNKISNRSEIESKTHIPIISTIGHNSTKGDLPVFENPKSSLSESFRGLRTNLQYMLSEKDKKVISITSTISGEGKTFCSTNLATIFAMAGKKTLLASMDLRKPKTHKIFNLDNEQGISNYLIGQVSLEDIVRETKIENLFIASAGPVPPNPAELLEKPMIEKLIAEAREIFDIIIIDTPPFGVVTDARIISRVADVSLFILRQNYSPLNILELLEEIYQKKEIGLMGIIMNDIKLSGYYGYGYRYYNYGDSYRYGYNYSYGNYSYDENS
jgi:tyrosine-protein kinase Etk/Wzc